MLIKILVDLPCGFIKGEVVEVTGPVSYKVCLNSDGTEHRRNRYQLRKGPATELGFDQHYTPKGSDLQLLMTVHNDEENFPVDHSPQSLRKSTRVIREPDKLNL